MDGLAKTFFEDPFYVYLVLALAGLASAGMWRLRRQKRYAVCLAGAGVLAGAAWLVETLVVTDRERIISALTDIAGAAERHDVAAAARFLDDDYGGWKGSKKQLVAAVRTALETYGVQKVRFPREPQVDLPAAGKAYARVLTVVTYGKGATPDGRTMIGWKLRWARRPAGWRIVEVEPDEDPLR